MVTGFAARARIRCAPGAESKALRLRVRWITLCDAATPDSRDPAPDQTGRARPVAARPGRPPSRAPAAGLSRLSRIAVEITGRSGAFARAGRSPLGVPGRTVRGRSDSQGENMKSIVLRALGAAAVAVCLSGSVYAQSSEPAASEAPAAAKSASKAAAKSAKQANRKLGYAVRKAISKQNGIDVSNITVRSKGGAITLEGSVPDAEQIEKAEAAAKTVPGVTSVSNKLSVQQQ